MSIKARKHLHLPTDVMEEMVKSGMDISAWATEAWINSKYSTGSLEEEINKTKEKLNKLEKKLKENKEFLEKLNKLTNPKEIKLLGVMSSKLKKADDFVIQEGLFKEWKKIYYNYFKIRLTTNMLKKRIELYLEQIK